jgi:CheY-like chemotaxis protein
VRRREILIVDDNPNDVAIALRALDRAGFDAVAVARSGEEALRSLALDGEPEAPSPAERPSVIFLDLKMPRVDGWEVLREIRGNRSTRSIPVVILSSSDHPEDVRRCYELGANSFLKKRFEARLPGSYLADAARYWIQLNEAPRPPRDDAASDPRGTGGPA